MTHPALDERVEELEDAMTFHERYEKALHNPNLARNIGTHANPYGQPGAGRMAWARGLDLATVDSNPICPSTR